MAGLLSVVAEAGTYTWTGDNGDGKWSTPGNWDYDDGTTTTSPATTIPTASDDVVINGDVTVQYVPSEIPGGDLIRREGTTLILSGGATLSQTSGAAWPYIHGAIVLDGGTYDAGTAENIRIGGTGSIRIVNRGVLRMNFVLTRDTGSTLCMTNGTIESTAAVTFLTGDTLKDSSVTCGNLTATGTTFDNVTLTPTGTRTMTGCVYYNMSLSYSGNLDASGVENIRGSGLAVTVGNELQPPDGYVSEVIDWVCALFAPQTADSVITLKSGSLRTSRTDHAAGFWQSGSTYINFPVGFTATYSYKGDAAYAYSTTFGTPKFKYNGAEIDKVAFETYFKVVQDGEYVVLSPNVDPWLLKEPTAAATGADAGTIATKVLRADAGGVVYYVLATSSADASAALSDVASLTSTEVAAAAGATVVVDLPDLTPETTYYAAFAIVAGGEVVATTDVVSFTASVYDAIYDGTAWTKGEASALNNASQVVYVTGTLVYNNEVEATGKTLERAQLTMNGLLNYQGDATVPLVLIDSALISQRSNDRLADSYYNLYPNDAGKRFIDFRHTTPSENTVHPASSYTFKYDNTQETVGQRWPKPGADNLFAYLFGGNRFLVDGATVSSDAAKGMFLLTDIQTDSKDEVVDDQPVVLTAGTMTLSTFDTFDATTRGAWTIENRGVVKLTTDVVLSQLTMLGTDSTVDLAGHALQVGHSGLTINGAAAVADGTYSAGTLPTQIVDSVGGGSLVVRETKRLVIIAR